MSVRYEARDRVAIITIDRVERRNAVDEETSQALLAAWRRFDADPEVDVGVLHGAGGVFSAGADLKSFDLVDRPEGYLGFTRMEVSKPTIAAVEGHCVAGGLEMALWCDLRIAGATAVFGFLERRFGVPLVDGGTQRLPRVVGRGIALELILTGREVDVEEAYQIGLVNRVVPAGEALAAAVRMAKSIAATPQETVRSDRRAVIEGSDLPIEGGLQVERRYGRRVMRIARAGASLFAEGAGRSGAAVGSTATPDAWSAVERPRIGDTLELEVDGIALRTHLAPPRRGDGPAVLVIHDRWGFDSTARTAVERLSAVGFVAVAVELLDPPVPDERAPRRLEPRFVGRALGAALRGIDGLSVVSGRIGVIGFGMGGGLAMWLAATEPLVAACVAFAPTSPWPGLRPSFEDARGAFLGHFGGDDDTASAHTASQLELELRTRGVDATFETYRSAGHEFYRTARPDGDDLEARELAWARTVAFFERLL